MKVVFIKYHYWHTKKAIWHLYIFSNGRKIQATSRKQAYWIAKNVYNMGP